MAVMTRHADAEVDAAGRAPAPTASRRWAPAQVAVGLAVAVGAGVFAYPATAAWITDLAHTATVSGYVDSVQAQGDAQRAALLEAARRYNDGLPYGPLRDPYILNARGGADDVEAGRADYESQLSTSADAPMARIRIAAIDVDLPIYHGTSEDTLARGIGHLYGSGLPVGGTGTHAVLTGHSGFVGATLFSRLGELTIGDTFVVDVAGESLVYRVDRITTVLPDEGDALRRDPAGDFVTLLTCTPTGVNSHRLLVRGERVTAEDEVTEQVAVAAGAGAVDIPWGSLAVLVAGCTVGVLIARSRVPRAPAQPAAPVS